MVNLHGSLQGVDPQCQKIAILLLFFLPFHVTLCLSWTANCPHLNNVISSQVLPFWPFMALVYVLSDSWFLRTLSQGYASCVLSHVQLNPCRKGYSFPDAKKVSSCCFSGMFWHVSGFPQSNPLLYCHRKSLGSSLPDFSHSDHVLLLGETKSLLPLEVAAWSRVSKVHRQPSSLLPSCTFVYIKAVHAVFAINSEQMNQTVLQSARGNKIFLTELSANGSSS